MPHTTFQVQTELDLKNHSSAGPALPLGPPSPSPQRGREKPECLTTEGWGTLATFSCGNAVCWHVRKAFFVVGIFIQLAVTLSKDSKRVSWNY